MVRQRERVTMRSKSIDPENFRKGNSKVVASRATLERLEKRDRKRLSRAELID